MVGNNSSLLGQIKDALAGLSPLAVAFSGGLDSRFLCHLALAIGLDVLALHGRGPHVSKEESAAAEAWAQARGLRLLLLEYDPLSLPEVSTNSRERCYACKRGLLTEMRTALAALREEGRVLCDGGNADDLRSFRPGLRAVAEQGVRSPLAELGLGKALIRQLARETGLENPGQAARPCLLTRLAYGLRPEASLLARLAQAESDISSLDAADRKANGPNGGFGEFRLRLAPAPLFQCLRLSEGLRAALAEVLAAHGFAPFELRLGSSVSGFFDSGAA